MTDLSQLLEKARQRVAAMSPGEYAAMIEAQRQSFVRTMSPCEHGVRDWEDCMDCRRAALEANNGQ